MDIKQIQNRMQRDKLFLEWYLDIYYSFNFFSSLKETVKLKECLKNIIIYLSLKNYIKFNIFYLNTL